MANDELVYLSASINRELTRLRRGKHEAVCDELVTLWQAVDTINSTLINLDERIKQLEHSRRG